MIHSKNRNAFRRIETLKNRQKAREKNTHFLRKEYVLLIISWWAVAAHISTLIKQFKCNTCARTQEFYAKSIVLVLEMEPKVFISAVELQTMSASRDTAMVPPAIFSHRKQ